MLFLLGLMLLCTEVVADCTLIPGKLKQIDAGAGQVYGVSDKEEIFRWVNNTWEQIPGKLTHVSVGPAGVWGVSRANLVYKFHNNSWMSVSGELKQVDAGGMRFLGGVNARDNVLCLRRSCTLSNSSVVSFVLLDGGLKYYSCGPMGCWGVNSNKQILYRYNVKPAACKGSHWQHVDGSLEMLEVGMDGSVFGVNTAGEVFKREGITKSTPLGTSWVFQDFCGTFKHVTYDDGILWLLDQYGDIYRCSDTSKNINNNE
ncbi:PREDICTED: fish-egg lectin-like [Nanorana parkeri]|uniref:fish-egg lectin-like n=1 Tax=Nanorana parkeri TaxID=125878 RepID=UPI000854EB93|nr:PREDICTED: fish-egg lectin-like [Nanorana parkeri]